MTSIGERRPGNRCSGRISLHFSWGKMLSNMSGGVFMEIYYRGRFFSADVVWMLRFYRRWLSLAFVCLPCSWSLLNSNAVWHDIKSHEASRVAWENHSLDYHATLAKMIRLWWLMYAVWWVVMYDFRVFRWIFQHYTCEANRIKASCWIEDAL